jgi:hypothetical protein
MNIIKKTDRWFLIIIKDDLPLPGKSFFDVISLLITCINFKFVIINDINGAAENGLIYFLQKKEGKILSVQTILNILNDIIQFDWGDFFLFSEKPLNWENPQDYYYPTLIKQTDTTVRAVDDTYIYIYTPFQVIVDIIKSNYKIESVKEDALEKLDFPY